MAGRWPEKHRGEQRTLLRMEFREFVNVMLKLPCQIVPTGAAVRIVLNGNLVGGGPVTLSDYPMAAHEPNPYESSASDNAVATNGVTPKRWPFVLWNCAVIYYIASAISLPFVNLLWFGEAPVLAIIQLPKSFLKSVAHQMLMQMVDSFGWSSGSYSPDYGATHGWAMGIVVTAPAISVIALFLGVRSLKNRHRLIAAVALCAIVDGIVTLWFDGTSNLKLYNARYF